MKAYCEALIAVLIVVTDDTRNIRKEQTSGTQLFGDLTLNVIRFIALHQKFKLSYRGRKLKHKIKSARLNQSSVCAATC